MAIRMTMAMTETSLISRPTTTHRCCVVVVAVAVSGIIRTIRAYDDREPFYSGVQYLIVEHVFL